MSEVTIIFLVLYGLGSLIWGGANLAFALQESDRPAARRFLLTPLWPIVLLFVGGGALKGAIRNAWAIADVPTPRLLRSKVYDADAGALSEVTSQGGELSRVLPPPARNYLQD